MAMSDGPQKLTIVIEQEKSRLVFLRSRSVQVQYNPHTLAFTRSVNWQKQGPAQRDTPELHYDHAEPRQLSIELIFDTYDSDKPEDEKDDVRKLTGAIYQLTTVEHHGDKHRPPVCQLHWGLQGMLFQGILESLEERETLFTRNGTPVRSRLVCRFKEWCTNEEDARKAGTKSADLAKRHVLTRGETLSSVAALLYEDPRLWRPIARANDIEDPGAVAPGTVLFIPTLTSADRPARQSR